MKQFSDRIPNPYIQNHINWCWAVAAKIVGISYCWHNNLSSQFSEGAAICGVVRKDHCGLRSCVCGSCHNEITVDALQFNVVEHAKDRLKNPDGNLPEDDEGKARALRYVITGNPYSPTPDIVVAGFYSDARDLLSTSSAFIDEAIRLGIPFIGNCLLEGRNYHSVVLFPVTESQLELYDPWDGYKDRFSKTQIFKSGFLTNQGRGVIKWIQYIRPHNT